MATVQERLNLATEELANGVHDEAVLGNMLALFRMPEATCAVLGIPATPELAALSRQLATMVDQRWHELHGATPAASG